jgi:hypothetical protein
VTPLDEETRKKLAEFCAKHEIILHGEGDVLNQPNRRIAAMETSASRRELILSECYTDESGLAMISEKFPALESLDLSYCGLGDGDFSSIQLASLGSAAPLDEKELFELAKQILPGCEISTLNYKFKP